MNPQKFTGEEGKFIPAADAKQYTARFHKKREKEGKQPSSYTEAQFFGKKQLQKLLDKDGCVGLRFYFGASGQDAFDDELVIVAVNADGVDLTSARIGLKDMPAADEDVLAGGPTCPHNCNP
jgi:hypothetical protein